MVRRFIGRGLVWFGSRHPCMGLVGLSPDVRQDCCYCVGFEILQFRKGLHGYIDASRAVRFQFNVVMAVALVLDGE